jgi:hypothetical protein
MCHCGQVSEQAGPVDGRTGVWDHANNVNNNNNNNNGQHLNNVKIWR